MQQQISLELYWWRWDMKEVITAVAKAVSAGYDTKNKLLAALPQFSIYRVALAIDALITADMAEKNLDTLSIHPDMDVIFELLKGKFILPLSVKDVATPGVRRVLINKPGCKNPAGVEALFNIKAVEI